MHIRADTVEAIVGQFIPGWRNKVFQVVTRAQQGFPGFLTVFQTHFRVILASCLVLGSAGDRAILICKKYRHTAVWMGRAGLRMRRLDCRAERRLSE